MDSKQIKLTRCKDNYDQTYYTFDGTERMAGPIGIKKHHYYNIYWLEEDGSMGHMIHEDTDYLRTLSDVKQWISEYDEKDKARQDARNADIAAREEEAKKRRSLIDLIDNNLTKDRKPSATGFQVGMLIDIVLPLANKNISMGDALQYALESNQLQMRPCRGLIAGVVALSNEDYDTFVTNLMDGYDFWTETEEDGIHGGTVSQDPRLQGKTFDEVINDPELSKIYNQTCREVVHVITSENREPIVANCEGQRCAKYAGFLQGFNFMPLMEAN
ncbi:hypothetical protein [Neptuniibacter sp. QD37_11]|uniref:hypothetical protein n=1 Tax=Neptuniibacter sp. QD37_11 TaxID=3398209 RepID=UPI0039F54F2C